jgi:hypothetical protein
METKIQRLKNWLCRLLQCEQLTVSPDPDKPVVTQIKGTNLEKFTYDGYQIECAVYADRVRISVYLKGNCLGRGWYFKEGEEIEAHDVEITSIPNYKLRTYVREYAHNRLTQG